MLLELLESAITPCAWHVRRMGYLYELLGIRGRYGRCRAAWEPHLERTRSIIGRAAARCPEKRKAVVLGSGMLLDVPLDDLARDFREVVLVDLIHPLRARWRGRRLGNVRLVGADISGVAEQVYRVARDRSANLPRAEPSLLLDDAQVDLVASVNLLSQLPYLPAEYLLKAGVHAPAVIEEFARGVVEAHLAYLRKFAGVVALVGDIERLTYDRNGGLIERLSALRGAAFPGPHEEWEWHLAPRPEAHRDYSYHRRVGAVVDLNGGRAVNRTAATG
jgi:hypothetical protein